jgi:Fuc2NAc and GlcNAc transferase
MHTQATPRGGGLAFVTPIILAVLVCAILFNEVLIGMLAFCLFAWGTLGLWDDRSNLSPKFRFVFQFVFAVVTVIAFKPVMSLWFTSSFGLELMVPIAIVVSTIGVMWFVNLYNFMDGIDGLAVSQAIVAMITLAVWFYADAQMLLCAICLLFAGACAGFLVFNWSPAKIFMGDVGSLSLGGFFACLILFGVSHSGIPVLSFVLLFWVFIFDSGVTLVRRLIQKKKVWQAHREHYYQRLAGAGMAHDKVVVLHLLFMIFSSLLASISVQYRDLVVPMLGVSVLTSFVLVGLVLRIEKTNSAQ